MPRVVMGLFFYPRGGSAHVMRSLARFVGSHGWTPTIVSGSLGHGGHGDASEFFAGADLHVLDYTEAAASSDPLAHDPPMHPSYEDRPGAPDCVFGRVDDSACARLVAAWSRVLETAGARDADVLHLSHLSPLNEAAARVAPDVPVVGHLHGTELLMLEEIAAGPPADWPHALAWANRMRGWASACERLIVLSPTQLVRVEESLGISPDRCVVVPNGFDPAVFDRREIDRMALWRRHLVEEPQGWRPGAGPGSVGYAEADLAVFAADAPVLVYVGRYTAVKRLGLLVRAYARARGRFRRPAPLVLLGGFPGEWEAEHPLEVVAAPGTRPDGERGGVFLAGWHQHDALADFFAASDVVVLPSVREQFGQVLVEAMACGLPAIAVDAHGPSRIVDDGRTGWLVAPDDAERLSAALEHAVNDDGERRRRGEAARAAARQRYSWPALAGEVAALYSEVAAPR